MPDLPRGANAALPQAETHVLAFDAGPMQGAVLIPLLVPVNGDSQATDQDHIAGLTQLTAPGLEIAPRVDNSDEQVHLSLSITPGALPAEAEKVLIGLGIMADAAWAPLIKVQLIQLLAGQAGDPIRLLHGHDDGPEIRALIFAELYQRNGAWKIRHVGQGFMDGPTDLLGHVGIAVAGAAVEDGGPDALPDEMEPPVRPEPAPAAAPIADPAPPPGQTAAPFDPGPARRTSLWPDDEVGPWQAPPSNPFQDAPRSRAAALAERARGDQAPPTPPPAEDMPTPTGPIRVTLDSRGSLLPKAADEIRVGCFVKPPDAPSAIVQSFGSNRRGHLRRAPFVEGDLSRRGDQVTIAPQAWMGGATLLLFAFIPKGVPAWSDRQVSLVLHADGRSLSLPVAPPSDRHGLVVAAEIWAPTPGSGPLKLRRRRDGFADHREADAHFGLDLAWTAG